MPEAPPSSPGHVGHTPQHAGELWTAARFQAIFDANVPRLLAAFGGVFASQQFGQLQRFRKGSTAEALARASDFGRRHRAGGVDPQPLDFLAGLTDPRLTKRPPDQP